MHRLPDRPARSGLSDAPFSIVDGPSGPGSRRSRLQPLRITGWTTGTCGTPAGNDKGEASSRKGRAKGSGQMSE